MYFARMWAIVISKGDALIHSAASPGYAQCEHVDTIEDAVGAPKKMYKINQHGSAAFNSIEQVTFV